MAGVTGFLYDGESQDDLYDVEVDMYDVSASVWVYGNRIDLSGMVSRAGADLETSICTNERNNKRITDIFRSLVRASQLDCHIPDIG